jgi:hypothetical protein
MGVDFFKPKQRLMEEDFKWVCKVLSHEDNKIEHYESLDRLVNLFRLKWDNDSKEFRLLNAFLKMFLKKTFTKLTTRKPL